jgi:hypothetical protein
MTCAKVRGREPVLPEHARPTEKWTGSLPFAELSLRPHLSTSGLSKFTTLSSFEYRRASLLLLSGDEARSASYLIGCSAAFPRSAHAETATKIPDRPPERLHSEPDFRNRGNPFDLLNGPCRSEPGGKFPDTPGIQSSRNPLQRRCAGISRSTQARAQQQAAAPIAPAGGGIPSTLTNRHCRGLLERWHLHQRRHRRQRRKGLHLPKTNHSWQSLEFAGSREDGYLGKCPMEGIARLFNFVQRLRGCLRPAWSYSPGMPEMAGFSALSSGS